MKDERVMVKKVIDLQHSTDKLSIQKKYRKTCLIKIIKDIARKINAKFHNEGVMAKKVIDLTTDGRTDGRTDRRTDRVIEVLRT